MTKYSYKGYTYQWIYDLEDDNVKILHDVMLNGRRVYADFPSREVIDEEEFFTFIDLGLPTREKFGSPYPVDNSILRAARRLMEDYEVTSDNLDVMFKLAL